MILFSAEAIFASSTSKSCIRIHLTEHEDFRSSTESTISTSLIHSIASVGNCEQIHTYSLQSCLPASKGCWCSEFVEMKIWNLQSLLVCSVILWRVSLTRDDRTFGWRSGLVSPILNWCLFLTLFHCWWVNRLLGRWTPLIQFLRIRCCAKTFPDVPCGSQMLGGPSLRLGIFVERLSIPSGIGWGGNDTGWLATREFPLRTDSSSWKSLESFMQLILFCISWILPVSSRIVSRSPINFLLVIVSNVEPWILFNSYFSLRLLSWASRRSQFCINSCSWRSW